MEIIIENVNNTFRGTAEISIVCRRWWWVKKIRTRLHRVNRAVDDLDQMIPN